MREWFLNVSVVSVSGWCFGIGGVVLVSLGLSIKIDEFIKIPIDSWANRFDLASTGLSEQSDNAFDEVLTAAALLCREGGQAFVVTFVPWFRISSTSEAHRHQIPQCCGRRGLGGGISDHFPCLFRPVLDSMIISKSPEIFAEFTGKRFSLL
jgi:hypothetical protein